MCRAARCATCGKTTWAGCGNHVDQVMGAVPQGQRCTCSRPATSGSGLGGRLRALLGRT